MAEIPDVRAELAAERQLVSERLAGLERELASFIEAAAAANADDEHDPEGATIAFERQHVVAHITHARDQLAQVDAALARVRAGEYGICAECGRPIAAARLEARPTASMCIACAGRASRR